MQALSFHIPLSEIHCELTPTVNRQGGNRPKAKASLKDRKSSLETWFRGWPVSPIMESSISIRFSGRFNIWVSRGTGGLPPALYIIFRDLVETKNVVCFFVKMSDSITLLSL